MILEILFFTSSAFANPYFDSAKVPTSASFHHTTNLPKLSAPTVLLNQKEIGSNILRVGVRVNLSNEKYQIAETVLETSGTQSYLKRSKKISSLGSYRAILRDSQSGEVLASDSIGTGKEYRKLVDEIIFRFPLPLQDVIFELKAEHPISGEMEVVLTQSINPSSIKSELAQVDGLEIREMKKPDLPGDSLRVNIYAEGYLENRKEVFWKDAEKTIATLVANRFPGVLSMHFFGIFKASQEQLGSPVELGNQPASRDTFLGMYFPYWNKFGRWTDVLYPSNEKKFRSHLAVAPYDYSLVLVDDSGYWGMGNFRVTTAIPASSEYFEFLLLHEAGHFFGLNEEYKENGRTELEFAPNIKEPWSQNMTFNPEKSTLKWKPFVSSRTPVPTPNSIWQSSPPIYGAYKGGYAGSPSSKHNHKPGLSCLMDRGAAFCDICKAAISDVVSFDMGK